MSKVAYCRVKWTISGLSKLDVEEYSGSTSTDSITIKLDEKHVPGWYFKVSANRYSDSFTFALKNANLDRLAFHSITLYYRHEGITESALSLTNKDGNDLSWNMLKNDIVKSFQAGNENCISMDVVIIIRKNDTNPPENIQTAKPLMHWSVKSVMDTIDVGNVLEVLKLAIAYDIAELEEKCMATILMHYKALKTTEKWKKLPSSIFTKILEVFNNSLNILRDHQLSEDDDEDEVNGDMAELADELGFHSEEELNEWINELGFHDDSDDERNDYANNQANNYHRNNLAVQHRDYQLNLNYNFDFNDYDEPQNDDFDFNDYDEPQNDDFDFNDYDEPQNDDFDFNDYFNEPQNDYSNLNSYEPRNDYYEYDDPPREGDYDFTDYEL